MASALLQVLMAVSSGVLGGRVASSLSRLMEEGILSARGRVSVRSLKLLYRNITSMENRIRSFLEREQASTPNPEVTKRNLEELAATCRSLQDQATSSIENWTDVVPEANIASAIDAIADLRAVIDGKNEELKVANESFEQLATHLDSTTTQNQQKIQAKEAELRAAQQELALLHAKLQQATNKVSSPNLNTLSRLLQVNPHKPPSLLDLAGTISPQAYTEALKIKTPPQLDERSQGGSD